MNENENQNLFAGLDVSTQSCKLVIIDLDKKNMVYQNSINYDNDMPEYNTENGTIKGLGYGVSESDPFMWIAAINRLFKTLKKTKGKKILFSIKAISVSGQQHGLVTLTEDDKLSRERSKLWNDFSTGEECELMTQAVGGVDKMIEEVGNSQRTGYTAPKIFHMVRNETKNWEKTKKILLVHNYINWYLTGAENGGVCVMERGDVSGTALWNPKTEKWSKNVIESISPDLYEKLPEVKNSRELIGTIGKNMVKKFGFSESCMVASGSGDNMMGAIGTGNYIEGLVTISLGTSGTAYSFMKSPYIDPKGEIAAFCDATNNYLPLLCISNMANGYDELLKKYNLSHSEFDEIVLKTPIGNGGKVLLPWYEGERTPDLPEAAPVYFGFGINEFTKDNLCRAVLEGHIMNLYEGFLKLPVSPTEIRLTGGMSKSETWRETISNIFNCPVVPVLGEGAAMGAALHAAWSFNKEKSLEKIANDFIILDEQKRVFPNEAAVKKYEKFKKIYFALSKRIRGLKADNPFKLYKDYAINE